MCESSDRSKCDEFKPDDMLPERKCEGDGEMLFDQCSKFGKCCVCVENAQKNEKENEKERKRERVRVWVETRTRH